MKAITLDSLDAQPGLRDDLPDPSPGPNEVVVRVRASSVNPVDLAVADGRLTTMADYEFPVVLGRDFAGTVEQIGPDVTASEIADEVYGFLPSMNPTVHAGSWPSASSFQKPSSPRGRPRAYASRLPAPPRWPQSPRWRRSKR